MSTTFPTNRPIISEATLASVRAAAHRYVLAGGSVFGPTATGGDDLDQHLANVFAQRSPKASAALEAALAQVSETALRETIHTEACMYADAEGEAAYLFGVCVGLEVATLTFGQLATIPVVDAPHTAKGGRR